MSLRRFSRSVLLVAVLVGCDGRGPGERVQPPTPPVMAKAALEEIAASGVLGSPVEVLQEQLELMKKSDPAKAAELLTACDKLKSLSDVKAIKAKAKEMAGKL
jgi:hypothetical protein